MRKRLSLVLTLLAWFMATGAQWDLVQTFAWGRMFIANSLTMPLLSAVKNTFNPDAMCSLCHTVQDAKQEESPAAPVAAGKSAGKIPLLMSPAGLVWFVPEPNTAHWTLPTLLPLSAERVAPPCPPPRWCA